MSGHGYGYRHQFGDTPIVRGADRRILLQDDTQDPPVLLVWSPTAGDWVAANQSSSATNLSATPSPTNVVVASDTGTDATIPAADGTNAGLFLPAGFTKLAGIASGATANSSDATLLNRANHTGTQSADTLTDGTTNKAFLATERTKLAGVATGATANDTDANLKARANHTGTQTAATISDFTEAAQDAIGAALTDTDTVDFTYNDGANTISAVVPPLDLPGGRTQLRSATLTAVLAGKTGAIFAANLTIDSSGNWNLIDTSLPGAIMRVLGNGTIDYLTATAGTNPRTLSAASTLIYGADSGWVSVGSYGSGWRAYLNSTDPLYLPEYRKFPDGRVLFRGMIEKTTALAIPETMFTMPAGFRPGASAIITPFVLPSAAGYTEVRARQSDGAIRLTGGGSATWISLGGLSYQAES